jgi:hypothetical protein
MFVKVIKKSIKFIIKILDVFSTKKILVLGDSHAQVFAYPLVKLYFPLTKFIVVSVGGATASGLENPNSKTQAYKMFKENLNENKNYSKIILMLGEVDTGFVIWYRAKKYNTNVKEMFNLAVKNYVDFIDKAKTYAKVTVISTPLPTITDDNDWGEVANLRKEVKVSQKERTKLTIEFNKAIERFCLTRNVTFINLDKESLGNNGLVKKELLNKNPNDHHYNRLQHVKLLAKYKKLIVF